MMDEDSERGNQERVPNFLDEDEEEYSSDEKSEESEPDYYQGSVYPTDYERSIALNMMNDLREESTLCDVTFTVGEVLFPAHQIVVCGSSRWLRSLLVGGEENVINMDMFEPETFQQVLGYMYGQSVTISLSSSEDFLKISKRLELEELENKIWDFLLSIVDDENCSRMHELADRYDNPHMKLVAWQVLQQAVPGYSVAPAHILEMRGSLTEKDNPRGGRGGGRGGGRRSPRGGGRGGGNIKGVGGEPKRSSMQRMMTRKGPEAFQIQEDDLDEEQEIPSIFSGHEDMADYIPPAELEDDVSAEERVKSWATRLQIVWKECQPEVDDPLPPIPLSRRRFTQDEREMIHETKPVDIDYKQKLADFYAEHNPEKLGDLGEILKRWQGMEDDMLVRLYKKYNIPIPDDLQSHIDMSKSQKQLIATEHEEQQKKTKQESQRGRGGGGQRGGRGGRRRGEYEEEDEYEEEEYDDEDEPPPRYSESSQGGSSIPPPPTDYSGDEKRSDFTGDEIPPPPGGSNFQTPNSAPNMNRPPPLSSFSLLNI